MARGSLVSMSPSVNTFTDRIGGPTAPLHEAQIRSNTWPTIPTSDFHTHVAVTALEPAPASRRDRRIWRELPIDPRTQFIRILELHPADSKDPCPVTATLRVETLTDSTIFDALSYAWNGSVCDHEMTCNGKRLLITKSLDQALRALRNHGYSRVWADAVCIDQSNDGEKSHQVSMMGKIYSQAKSTVVWLGDPEKDVAEGLKLISQLSRAFTTRSRKESLVHECHYENFRNLNITSSIDVYGTPVRQMEELFQQKWFARAW